MAPIPNFLPILNSSSACLCPWERRVRLCRLTEDLQTLRKKMQLPSHQCHLSPIIWQKGQRAPTLDSGPSHIQGIY